MGRGGCFLLRFVLLDGSVPVEILLQSLLDDHGLREPGVLHVLVEPVGKAPLQLRIDELSIFLRAHTASPRFPESLVTLLQVVRGTQHLAVGNLRPAALAPRNLMVGVHVLELEGLAADGAHAALLISVLS